MMKPFRERNPVLVGAASLVILAMVLVAALRADDLPIIGGGDTYHAMFTEAGGLKVNDEVRIAGVRVGKVNTIELDRDQVKVTLTLPSSISMSLTTPIRTPAMRTSSLAWRPPVSSNMA